jgi:hypothetical protein
MGFSGRSIRDVNDCPFYFLIFGLAGLKSSWYPYVTIYCVIPTCFLFLALPNIPHYTVTVISTPMFPLVAFEYGQV